MPSAMALRRGARSNGVAALLFLIIAFIAVSPSGAGDAARGAGLYSDKCGGCHSITENGAGPRHADLFGRRAGTQPGFEYSRALKKSRIVWDEALLDQWLSDPNRLVPGNKMVVQLASDPKDRADIIAYLRSTSHSPTQ